jgi:hypothetical protein
MMMTVINGREHMTIEWPSGVPLSEVSVEFLQGMANRMATSFYKYGRVADAYPSKVDALRSMQVRLDRYAASGNTEHLVDAANFLMIEFMHPSHPSAHFTPEDSHASAGRFFRGEINRSHRGNKDI